MDLKRSRGLQPEDRLSLERWANKGGHLAGETATDSQLAAVLCAPDGASAVSVDRPVARAARTVSDLPAMSAGANGGIEGNYPMVGKRY